MFRRNASFAKHLGFYYVNSRYYDPEICRWINADGAISNVGGDIRGYNLFAYCMNNPVNMSDNTGNWPSWNDIKAGFKKTAKKVVSVVTKVTNSIKESFSLVNYVQKTHITTPTKMLDLGILFGKVGFSSTVTKQNKEPGLIHRASDVGNDASEYSVGINIINWLGADVGVSNDINVFVSAQATPWVHGKVSFGCDGIGAVIGFDVGDISYDFEVNGGWGIIAIFFAPQIIAYSCQLSVAPAH